MKFLNLNQIVSVSWENETEVNIELSNGKENVVSFSTESDAEKFYCGLRKEMWNDNIPIKDFKTM